MATGLEQFAAEFFQDVHQHADASGRFVESAFFELFCDHLVEHGEIDEYTYAPFGAIRGVRVDGYGGDPGESKDELILIISDFEQSGELNTIVQSDIDPIFKRLEGFVQRSLDPDFRHSIEDNQDAFDLAQIIAKRIRTFRKLKLVLITNRPLSARVDGWQATAIGNAQVTYNVWDISRLYRFVVAGQGREEIEIDFEKDFSPPLRALPAHFEGASTESFLVAVPGKQLARIYDRWSTRLLEQNVRVFLQARGNVNRGIRDTIENEPDRFFAYNNGITATAEEVETRVGPNGLELVRLKNFQIVNGGQTTASIHAAFVKSADLVDDVFVQMKLSEVRRDQALELVPKISEFANTQNRVNAADFFANHPFHVRMEVFSRHRGAPSPDGAVRETKWFYERARGQYANERALLRTPSKQKTFDLEYPKKQVFGKTDLAKFLQVWREVPHIVSRGAQKNFVDFAQYIGSEWGDKGDDFNERYFKHLVAQAIIFRTTEKLVAAQLWYEGGYRANIVAHGISRLAYEARKRKATVNLDQVWKDQGVGTNLERALVLACAAANEVILNPDAGVRNFSEWAKQQACWARIQRREIAWPAEWIDELKPLTEQQSDLREARKAQKELSGIEAQTVVFKVGGEFWKEVLEWGTRERHLSSDEIGILTVAAAIPLKVPTDRQSMRVLSTLKRLHAEGLVLGRELVA